jgi:hypothetical protein
MEPEDLSMSLKQALLKDLETELDCDQAARERIIVAISGVATSMNVDIEKPAIDLTDYELEALTRMLPVFARIVKIVLQEDSVDARSASH